MSKLAPLLGNCVYDLRIISSFFTKEKLTSLNNGNYQFRFLLVGGGGDGSGSNTRTITVIVVLSVIAILLIALAVFLYIRYKDKWCGGYDYATGTFYTDLNVSQLFALFLSDSIPTVFFIPPFCNILHQWFRILGSIAITVTIDTKSIGSTHQAPTPQNIQTHSNNSLAFSNKLFERI